VLLGAVHDVIAANGLIASDARIRVTVTAGVGPPGSSRGRAAPVTFVVAVPFVPSAPNASVVVAPWTRNERGATAGLKTISYAANVRALAYAEARGASEALFANTAGNLCEATGSNVFVVVDGELRTPPPAAGCLLGVTRALLLELAADVGVAGREVDVPMAALVRLDEAFLSSTTREVQTITAIDGHAVVQPTASVAARLADAFRALVARDLDP
jgi:branched-chain amino acid aminotransferase